MVELSEQDIMANNRQSSKGNQLKWHKNELWYKADYTGYEGMTEYVVSNLLKYSNLNEREYICYDTEEICYGYARYLGCSSANFLPKGWRLITLERLFQNFYHQGLNKSIYLIRDMEDRIRFLAEQTARITGLKYFGEYMSKLLTVDAFFLNEDRHTHNIAVLMDEEENYHYCPIFDNGAGLLSDITMDYPMNAALDILMDNVKSKTFSRDFDDQLDAAEKIYGQHIKFEFGEKDVWSLLEKEPYYSAEVKERIMEIVRYQRRKYSYLF